LHIHSFSKIFYVLIHEFPKGKLAVIFLSKVC